MSIISINTIEDAEKALDEIMDEIVHDYDVYLFNNEAQKYVAQASNDYLYVLRMIKDIATR